MVTDKCNLPRFALTMVTYKYDIPKVTMVTDKMQLTKVCNHHGYIQIQYTKGYHGYSQMRLTKVLENHNGYKYNLQRVTMLTDKCDLPTF